MGHEKVPHGFGLRTGDHGDTADGAGSGKPAQTSKDLLRGIGRSELWISVVFLLENNTSEWHVLRLTLLQNGPEGMVDKILLPNGPALSLEVPLY